MRKQFEPIRTLITDMTIDNKIKSDYFNWMYDMMCEGRFAPEISYRSLFEFLHEAEFTYFIPHDENRAEDGIYLRYRYCVRHGCEDLEHYLDGPCSVLEMIVALAIRCEESIMDDTRYGDRTSQWFWGMISNLGLGSMTDNSFDEDYVKYCVERFLNREYAPDGRGGLFTIRNCEEDLRKVEIWYQLCWYLDTII